MNYQYMVTVPQNEGASLQDSLVAMRINEFNSYNRQYLIFDKSDGSECKFVLVTRDKISNTAVSDINEIFEAKVQVDELGYRNISPSLERKINAAKTLMSLCRFQTAKTLLCADSPERVLERAGKLIGFGAFQGFLREIRGYIAKTDGIKAKGLYNIVFVSDSEVRMGEAIELFCHLLVSCGVLAECSLVSADASNVARGGVLETGAAVHLEDAWKREHTDGVLEASDDIKLLEAIRKSDNVYITVMNRQQYEAYYAIDCFRAAFPHAVYVEEPTEGEKLAFVTQVAAEYGISVCEESFKSQDFSDFSIDKLDADTRAAIKRKLISEEPPGAALCLEARDFEGLEKGGKTAKSKTALEELEELIGMEGAKNTVREIVAFLDKRGKSAVPCLHMAFRGNPGTGKTTVARLLARVFAETGITKRDKLVETDRGGLVGMYVGHTAEKTKRCVEKAMGGVLFIDEAYSLLVSDSKVDFGHEAVATLVKEMEDKRQDFVCIFAGYTNEMNDMLSMNPGLRDRVQFFVDFDDYSPADLLRIFDKMCGEGGYRLSSGARRALSESFCRLAALKSPNFSNGRLVRKLFERARMKQALRTEGDLISKRDIDAVLAEKDIAAMFENGARGKIGFLA